MSDVLVRLKVDSKEYESKIERARAGFLNLEQSLKNAGKTFASAGAEQVNFAKSLGNMQTVAQTAKGKLSELTKAYTDLSLQYKRMTDEEKKSPFGQALNESLGQLRGRIGEMKSQLGEVNSELGNTNRAASSVGDSLEQLAGKFGLNVSQLTSVGAALAAVTGALKVAKDAFFNNEEQLDEWGRVVETSTSLYNGFLDALNAGDISGYLQRISSIASAAREAYDALDELATFNAFNQYKEAEARTNMSEAIAAYRTGEGSKSSAKAAAEAYKNELKARQEYETNAYNKAVADIAGERGVDAAALKKILTGSHSEFAKIKGSAPSGSQSYINFGGLWSGNGVGSMAVAANATEKMGEALRRMNDSGELDHLQALGAKLKQTGDEIAHVDSQMARLLGGSRGGGGSVRGSLGGGASYATGGLTGLEEFSPQGFNVTESLKQLQNELSSFKMALANATNQGDYSIAKAGIASTQRKLGAQPFALAMGISTESVLGLQDEVTAAMEELRAKLPKIEIEMAVPQGIAQEGEKTGKSWQAAAQAVSSVGSALQGLDDPSAKIAGLVGSAIANIALGFATSTSKSAGLGVFGWIAATVAGLGTMMSTISAIKSVTAGSYEEGGIVPGNSFHGDHLMANVNSGELILNTAQQDNLANILNEVSQGGGGGGGGKPYVNGEQIYLGLNNFLKRSGKGEMVTSH